MSDVQSFGDDKDSDDIFRDYKPDQTVTVFYDPNAPSDATLVPGVGTWTIVGLQYAWLIFGCGVLYLLINCIRIKVRGRIPKASEDTSLRAEPQR